MAANGLVAKDLSVGWNGKTVARIAAFELNEGEIVAFAGGNGVGKSTTIKTLGRQIPPTGGSVSLNDRDITSMTPRSFAQQVSYVPQLVELPHAMLVEDMVALGRNPHQEWWSWNVNQADRQAIDIALEQTELIRLRRKPVRELSGGERQRVSIATALAQQTRFMLLDEPTAHLDYKHQLQLLSLLGRLREQGLGILLVLHDINYIGRIADRALLLRNDGATGVVAASGPPQSVLTSDNLRTVYGINVSAVVDPATGITAYLPVDSL